MRRFTVCLLLAALLLSIAGCGAPSAPETVPTEQKIPETVTATPTAPATVPVTEPQLLDGFLFLTVSRLTFTVAGESEDVYIGSLPREEVTFGTEDETVAVFENGVLTAVGAGETTAFAEYGDQRLECTVGCLAGSQEELEQVDPALLRTAKRFPPEAGMENISYFDKSALVGDSIAYGMFRWNTLYGELGNILFLCQGGAGMYGFVVKVSGVTYQGQPMSLEDALQKSESEKVFVMLGQNDLSYMTVDETMEKWPMFLEMIREKNPDIEIYLQSCVPEWKELHQDNTKNELILEHNIRLKQFAEENGCHFIDLYTYAVDHTGRMPAEYNLDNLIHLNEAGCRMWMQMLRAYANYQTLKGE